GTPRVASKRTVIRVARKDSSRPAARSIAADPPADPGRKSVDESRERRTSNGFHGCGMFPSCRNMTLEMFLWSIPVGSLAAALTLIAVQAWELTRDCAAGKAILAGASGPARAAAAETPQP